MVYSDIDLIVCRRNEASVPGCVLVDVVDEAMSGIHAGIKIESVEKVASVICINGIIGSKGVRIDKVVGEIAPDMDCISGSINTCKKEGQVPEYT